MARKRNPHPCTFVQGGRGESSGSHAPLVDPGLHGGFVPSQIAFVPPTQRALGNLDDGARPLGRVGLRRRVRRTVGVLEHVREALCLHIVALLVNKFCATCTSLILTKPHHTTGSTI